MSEKFSLNRGQFRARFVVNVLHPVGSAIPIAGIAGVAFNLVQHGVNPRGGAVFELLDDFMRGIPFAGQGQFNRFEQVIVRCAHGFLFYRQIAPAAN